MLHLEFNSDSENEGIARIVTAAYIMKFDPDMEEMDDIKTAVSEAVTNCIVHAYHNPDGKISMDLSDQNGILRIEIKDQGIGIPDVKKAMEPMFTTKPEDDRSGMGFSFMEAFMDTVEVESKVGEGTSVKMTKTIGKGNDSDHDKENRRSRQAEWIRRGNCYGLPKKETKQHESRSFLIMLD